MDGRLEHVIRMFNDGMVSNPKVFLFDKEDKSLFDDCKAALKDNGFTLVDVNQTAVVNPEDFNMPITEMGFSGPTGKETVNDFLISDEEKRYWVARTKIEAQNNEKAVLVIKYNEQILKNEPLYNTIRIWLKEGIEDSKNTKAIVYLETEEKLLDFCYYGMHI